MISAKEVSFDNTNTVFKSTDIDGVARELRNSIDYLKGANDTKETRLKACETTVVDLMNRLNMNGADDDRQDDMISLLMGRANQAMDQNEELKQRIQILEAQVQMLQG